MTITQTVEILTDRRITLEVPREMPTGRADIIVQFPARKDAPPSASTLPVNGEGKIILNKQVMEKLLADAPHTHALAGILSSLGNVTLEQIRDERLARHLK